MWAQLCRFLLEDTPGFPGASGAASADASVVSSGVASPVKAHRAAVECFEGVRVVVGGSEPEDVRGEGICSWVLDPNPYLKASKGPKTLRAKALRCLQRGISGLERKPWPWSGRPDVPLDPGGGGSLRGAVNPRKTAT